MRVCAIALSAGLLLLSGAFLPAMAQAPSPPTAAAVATPIGKIITVKGLVNVEHVTAVVPLQASLGGSPQAKAGDLVYKGDVVSTGPDGTVGITFSDGTAFNLASNARMVLNEFVYDPKGTSNSTLFSLTKGTFTFVAGKVARTGDMKIDTPVATMGIRGTTPHVEIRDDGTVAFSTLIEDKKAIDKTLEKITAPVIKPVKKERQTAVPAETPGATAPPASPVEQTRQPKNADSKPTRKGNSAYDINVTPKICAAC